MGLNVLEFAKERTRLCRKICQQFESGEINQGLPPRGPELTSFEDPVSYATYKGVEWLWVTSVANESPRLGGDKQTGGRCFKVRLIVAAEGILGGTLKIADNSAIDAQLQRERDQATFHRGEDLRRKEQFGVALPPIQPAPPARA